MTYTGFRLTGRGATLTRPADKAQVVAGDTYAVDATSDTADDGTEIDATWVNRVKKNLERLADLGGALGDGDDQLRNAIVNYVASAGGGGGGSGAGVYDVTSAPFNAVGDGVADDRAAIQAAIDAAALAGGGEVYLPPRIYRITQGLNVKSNVHLRGAGRSSIIRPKAGSMTGLTLAGISVFASIAMVGVTNATVSGILLDHGTNATLSNGIQIGALVAGLCHNFSTTTTSGDPGAGLLRFNNATLASVTAVYVSETDALSASVSTSLGFTNGQALRFFSIADPRNWVSVTVSGSVTDNGAWRSFAVTVTGSSGAFSAGDKIGIEPGVGAVDPRSVGCTVIGCHIVGTELHEYLIWNLGGRSTRILCNDIAGKASGIPSTDTPCIEIYGGEDVICGGNTLRNANQGVAVFSVAGYPASSCRDIVISGNTFDNVYDGVLVSSALKAAAGGEIARVLVEGNAIAGATNRGVVLAAGDGAAIDLARASGNVSSGTPSGGHFVVSNHLSAVRSDIVFAGNTARTVTGTSWGYSATNGKSVVFDGNAARGTLYYGAILQGGAGNRVVGNDFDGTLTVGIQIDTDATEVVVSGNTLRGHTGYGIYADNTVAGLDMHSNHFDRASGGTEVEAILSTASNARATGNTLGYTSGLESPVSVSGVSLPVSVVKTLNLAVASSPYHNLVLPAADVVVLSGDVGSRVFSGFAAGSPGQRVSIYCTIGACTFNQTDPASSANNRLLNAPSSLGNAVFSGTECLTHWLYVGGSTNKWVLEGSVPAQAPALADGSVTTAKLANNAVTLAKLATIATGRVLGNVSGSSAIPAELSAGDIMTMLLGVDGAGSGLDADLLDGQSSAYYADIPARLGYTPLNRAGDTMTGALSIASGTLTASTPIDLTQTWNNSGVTFTGLKVNITNTASASGSMLFDFQLGGTSLLKLTRSQVMTLNGVMYVTNPGGVQVLDNGGVFILGAAQDTILARDAAHTFAQRSGTNAQAFRIYGTYTNASNYERAAINTGADYAEFAAETAGTGDDNLDVRLTPAGTGNVRFGSHSAIGSETVTGFITIKDAGGTVRKLAVVS